MPNYTRNPDACCGNCLWFDLDENTIGKEAVCGKELVKGVCILNPESTVKYIDEYCGHHPNILIEDKPENQPTGDE